MSKKLSLRLKLGESLDKKLQREFPEIVDYRVLSKSLDARGANRGKRPLFLYTLEVISAGESFDRSEEEFKQVARPSNLPIIVGAGPAGLFCALRLLEYGVPSIVLERGVAANQRMKDIAKFWRYGQFDSESNVCFGEGGAGLFSDGKLITRVKSPFIKYVMEKFVEFGAPQEVAYESNPHLGSNKIRKIISEISNRLLEGGCQIRYQSRVDELLVDGSGSIQGVKLQGAEVINSDFVVLAVGHSAHNMYRHLAELNASVTAKDFSIGVRVEHRRELINQIQYGQYSTPDYVSELGTARYRLSYHDKITDRGTYSFCMCPGGYVLSSGTQADGIVVNGMSNFSRSSPWSNSALVVTVASDSIKAPHHVLKGMHYQRDVEQKAFHLSKKVADGRNVPGVSIADFLNGKVVTGPKIKVKNSCPSGVFQADFAEILPKDIIEHLKQALVKFDRQMPGFIQGGGLLMAPETRTSAPVTVGRDRMSLESTAINGLYPCGEGAGYAGGITSAAIDGIKVANSIVEKLT